MTPHQMTAHQQYAEMQYAPMPAKNVDLELMSLEDLWSLHEDISAILSARIRAEKRELEKRLALLNRGMDVVEESSDSRPRQTRKTRRKYPRVLPKYFNPQTSETWSGRGKRPRWLVAAMKSGRKMDEFRISEASGSGGRRRVGEPADRRG